MDDEDSDKFIRSSIVDGNYSKHSKRREKTVSGKGKRDNAIQGTNDSSIVSKRSVERSGYDIKSSKDQWLRYFVKKPARRAPLINLGYFIRMKAIERVVDEFLAEPTTGRKLVVNLGCGYDPLPFVYLSGTSSAVFVDVDFPDLVRHKSDIIRETPALLEVIGSYIGEQSDEIRSEKYHAVGCDLSNLSLFDTALRSVEQNLENANILFISEVAITYMPTKAADALIAFTSQFPKASFAILEQITPAGPAHPFATTMGNHFKKLTTPLLSLPHYPTLRSQARRFLDAGYAEIEACDLNTFFYGVIQHESRIDALNMELFDEYEELNAFLCHYFVLVARNQTFKLCLCPRNNDWQYINWKKDMLLNGNMTAIDDCHESKAIKDQILLHSLDEQKSIQRRFPAMCSISDGVLIHGGLSTTTRLSTSLHVCSATNSKPFEISSIKPSARMCHTLTSLGNGRVLLVGGRDAPNAAMNDVWIFDEVWRQVESLPYGTYRHAAVQVDTDKVVVFGGRRESDISADWLLYTYRQGWQKLDCLNACPGLWGASLAWSNCRGVLVGGVNDDGECPGDVYTWYLDEKSHAIALQKWCLTPLARSITQRYGCKTIPWRYAEFLIIGGAGSHRLLPWSDQFVFLIPQSETVQLMDVRNMAAGDPWFVGHDVTFQERSGDVIIVGGGGVCFSFGSFWNGNIFQLNQSSAPIRQWKLFEETPTRHVPPSHSFTAQGHPKQIRRIKIDSQEQWHQVLQSSQVCVLEGLDFGPCVSKWTPEYLKSHVGSDKQVIIHSTSAEAMNFLSKNFEYTSCSFGDFIDSVFSPAAEKLYLRAVSKDAKNKPTKLEDDFPGLAKDFQIPTILRGHGGIDEEKIFSTVLRVGGVGTSMWLHYDVMANILTQIVGKKEILIFHPFLVNELDIPPGASSSRINDIFISPLRHKAFTATLEPGDALYIPPLWPHATKPLTPNVGVNVFWKSFKDKVYDHGKDVYGNKDLAGYMEGRKLVEKVVRGFKDVDDNTREFYIKRLAAELEEML